jgi:hypothetical protein
MTTSELLRLTAITIALGAAIPAQATPDGRMTRSGPHWLEQTVFQPICPGQDCDCDCRSGRFCPAVCPP